MSIIRLTISLFICLSSTSQQGTVATLSCPCVCWVSKYTRAVMKERERETESLPRNIWKSICEENFKKSGMFSLFIIGPIRNFHYRELWLLCQLESYLPRPTFFHPKTPFSCLSVLLSFSPFFLQLHKRRLTFWCWTLILFQTLSLIGSRSLCVSLPGFILLPAGYELQSTMLGRGCWSAGVFEEH